MLGPSARARSSISTTAVRPVLSACQQWASGAQVSCEHEPGTYRGGAAFLYFGTLETTGERSPLRELDPVAVRVADE
jgi:hypothetical protein